MVEVRSRASAQVIAGQIRPTVRGGVPDPFRFFKELLWRTCSSGRAFALLLYSYTVIAVFGKREDAEGRGLGVLSTAIEIRTPLKHHFPEITLVMVGAGGFKKPPLDFPKCTDRHQI